MYINPFISIVPLIVGVSPPCHAVLCIDRQTRLRVLTYPAARGGQHRYA